MIIIGIQKIQEEIEKLTGKEFHVQTLLRWFRGKKLACYKIGKNWAVKKDDLEKFLKGE